MKSHFDNIGVSLCIRPCLKGKGKFEYTKESFITVLYTHVWVLFVARGYQVKRHEQTLSTTGMHTVFPRIHSSCYPMNVERDTGDGNTCPNLISVVSAISCIPQVGWVKPTTY